MRAGRELLAAGDEGPDLYLCGPVGSGKTRLACTVLNEAWRSDKRSAAFVRVPMLLYRLQPRDSMDPYEMFDRLIETALVVLDDLGAEREAATDYTRRTLLMLYEARHDSGRRTVWTSNRTPRAIGESMGDDRLASRIAGRCRIVALEGRDWRLRQAEPHTAAGNVGGADRRGRPDGRRRARPEQLRPARVGRPARLPLAGDRSGPRTLNEGAEERPRTPGHRRTRDGMAGEGARTTMTTDRQADGDDLTLVCLDGSWRFHSPTGERFAEEMAHIHEVMDNDGDSNEEAMRRLDHVLRRHPVQMEALTTRAGLKLRMEDTRGALDDATLAYEYAKGKIPPGFRERLEWCELPNRPFLRGCQVLVLALIKRGDYDQAAGMCRRMLRWNPNDNHGMRLLLGPALLRAGETDKALKALRKHQDNPGVAYDLALALIETEQWVEAATTIRRADAINPYLAYEIVFERRAPPMAAWTGSNVHDWEWAEDYGLTWGERWHAEPGNIDFLWWVHTHPAVAAERAAIQEMDDELLWTDGDPDRRYLRQRRDDLRAGIDDELSNAIVRPRAHYQGGEPEHPWLALRAKRSRDEGRRRTA